MGHYITCFEQLTSQFFSLLYFVRKFVCDLAHEEHDPCARVCVGVCVRRVSLFDYQAMCKMNLHSVSSARPLLSASATCSF